MSHLKALVIQGPVDDLGDLLQIARAEGCKALGVDKVYLTLLDGRTFTWCL
jgi:hypothetical protein